MVDRVARRLSDNERNGFRAKVLVVESCDTTRRMIRKLFNEIGVVDTEEAETTNVAFERFRSARYELITSSWNTSPKNGLQLLQAIRQEEYQRSLQKTPFIMITGKNSAGCAAAAREAGADGYLTKPFSLDQFQLAISHALGISLNEVVDVATDHPVKAAESR